MTASTRAWRQTPLAEIAGIALPPNMPLTIDHTKINIVNQGAVRKSVAVSNNAILYYKQLLPGPDKARSQVTVLISQPSCVGQRRFCRFVASDRDMFRRAEVQDTGRCNASQFVASNCFRKASSSPSCIVGEHDIVSSQQGKLQTSLSRVRTQIPRIFSLLIDSLMSTVKRSDGVRLDAVASKNNKQ